MRLTHHILLLMCAVLLAACKPSLPDDVLSESEMVDVIYDIHLSHFIPLDANDNNAYRAIGDGKEQYARQLLVLQKYGLSEKEWENSIAYYTRHTELLKQVYGKVFERMSASAQAMGVSVNGMIDGNVDDNASDTTDIWNDERMMVLTSSPMNATRTWTLTPKDSLLVKGEKLTMSFQTMFLVPTAQQRTAAVMAITLDNDSTIQATQNLSGNGLRTVMVTCPPDRSIRSIRGMITMMRTSDQDRSTQEEQRLEQVLVLTNIRLSHTAPPPPPPSEENKKDTTNVTDSLRRDTIAADDRQRTRL